MCYFFPWLHQQNPVQLGGISPTKNWPPGLKSSLLKSVFQLAGLSICPGMCSNFSILFLGVFYFYFFILPHFVYRKILPIKVIYIYLITGRRECAMQGFFFAGGINS